jgi:hypothetical protein
MRLPAPSNLLIDSSVKFIEYMTPSPKHMSPISPLFVWVSSSPVCVPCES